MGSESEHKIGDLWRVPRMLTRDADAADLYLVLEFVGDNGVVVLYRGEIDFWSIEDCKHDELVSDCLHVRARARLQPEIATGRCKVREGA